MMILKRCLGIFIIFLFFLILKFQLDFCLEIASIMLLVFVVKDLLKQSPPLFAHALLAYALSLLLDVSAFLINDSFNILFLHLLFSVLIGFNILFPYVKNRISKKDPLAK